MAQQPVDDRSAANADPHGHAAHGHFEIDEDLCIGCGLCRERAPDNMETGPGSSVARVVRQPANDHEEAACREAAEYCPTGGILVEE
ncbi:MAG: ferredoxin [Deltaproteobacteria bacterium]|nr:ferredoxin [Deltaproteobacteria bacterium]